MDFNTKEFKYLRESNLSVTELTFLLESNRVEREYSIDAWTDAVKAWEYAKEHAKTFSLDVLLGIHQRLLQNIQPGIAGKIRTCKMRVGTETCIEPEQVPQAIEEWCNTFYEPQTKEEIRKHHIQYMKIHPHEDGNGRTGRITMNLQRINKGYKPLIIHVQRPELTKKFEGIERQEYYQWFD